MSTKLTISMKNGHNFIVKVDSGERFIKDLFDPSGKPYTNGDIFIWPYDISTVHPAYMDVK